MNVCKFAKHEKLKRRRLMTKKKKHSVILKTAIALFQDIDLMKKLYSQYECIGEVRCRTKDSLL